MTKFEKIQICDALRTIIHIADDCLYEIEDSEFESKKDDVKLLLGLRMGRIIDEVDVIDDMNRLISK